MRWCRTVLALGICLPCAAGCCRKAPRCAPQDDVDMRAVARLRLQPVRSAPPASPATALTAANYARHIAALKEQIPGADFHIVVEPPFVVVGNESEAMVRRRATQTIRWAVDRLKKEYFDHDPAEILTIWLWKDRTSYERDVESIWGEKPTTPFGYYSREHRALIMNISTGGGTLVHELAHPLMEANFPRCPAWFNEGLGSLYEQCGDRNGRIWGYTNWRLAGLQKAIRAGSVPSFKTLCSTTHHGFYRADPGTNYAQARYLCYYLQEKGLLRPFYRQFRARVGQDPTGYETLQEVLGKPNMGEFQKQWEAFVLALHFD